MTVARGDDTPAVLQTASRLGTKWSELLGNRPYQPAAPNERRPVTVYAAFRRATFIAVLEVLVAIRALAPVVCLRVWLRS